VKRTLLYVDDQPENLIVFRAAFDGEFEVLEASSATEALQVCQTREIPVLVADQRMPDMTGVELCQIVRREYPHTIRMILTGYSDAEAMMDSINQGHVYSFVTKPWNRESLRTLLLRGFEAYELAVCNSALLERLEHTERCAALGQCAARIAHEMRNQCFVLPLIELIETRYRDHVELCELAAIARQTHDRLTELIDEVRSFARRENEQYRMIPANLADVVREAVELAGLHGSVPRRALKLHMGGSPLVACHPVRIQQVVFNLVRNAADAVLGRENPEIHVTVDEQDGAACITVRDNGPGIDPACLDRIGEAFFTTKGSEGTGVGLDICRRIAAGHGGTLTWESVPGQGATFTVRLPRHDPSKGD
jgi:signal transduction histidine kinase